MDYFLHVAILVLIYAILGISYNLLMGFAALFSMAHAAMFGLGAYTSALLAIKMGLNVWLALIVALAVTAASGAVIGIPALRVRSHYLVVLSFGFQMVLYSLMMNLVGFTGGESGVSGIPRPSVFGMTVSTKWQYLVIYGLITALVWLVARRIGDSPFGRVLKAIRNDEEATRALGKNLLYFKVTVFMASGALAAVAGSLYAHYITFINPFTFSLSESVFILAIVVFGGSGNFLGSVSGALILVAIPELLRFVRGFSEAVAGPFRQVLYGLMLMLMVRFRPQGLIPEYSGSKQGIPQIPTGKQGPSIRDSGAPLLKQDFPLSKEESQNAPGPATEDLLKTQELYKYFGGIAAVNGLNLTLRKERITGLIGPNGAGKTTIFNLITGFFHPDKGNILWRGREITYLPPHTKALMGIARTFQELRLFPNMTVLDTVLVARPKQRGENILLSVIPLPAEEKAHREKALSYLEFVGLADKREELTENLSYAEQKLLSLARILATEADLILLDEPTSGLDPNSISRALSLVTALPKFGKTICIIEHNLDVIRDTAQWIYFLAEGRVVTEGTPDKIFADTSLAEIYFGGGSHAASRG
jgi:branched-chain amino acid transport system permease protein